MREVAGQFEKPALLFSGGKDSITLVHLALKAFRPGKFPFPLVHIDTGHNFQEALISGMHWRKNRRETNGKKSGDTIRSQNLAEPKGKFASRNALQTFTLLDTINEFKFDAVSVVQGAMKKKQGRKKGYFLYVMNLANGILNCKDPNYGTHITEGSIKGENVRVFPISNWTELDIWNYIRRENIDLPSIYFAHDREVLEHEGQLVALLNLSR
jgi:sulfate adenylyltransferase subunit 2